jgi:hypothetical protein
VRLAVGTAIDAGVTQHRKNITIQIARTKANENNDVLIAVIISTLCFAEYISTLEYGLSAIHIQLPFIQPAFGFYAFTSPKPGWEKGKWLLQRIAKLIVFIKQV